MFDELFGRAELKERIETLEDERAELRDRLEAEQERRKDAVTDRQAAERRVNELEDRITQLRDRIDRLEDGEQTLSYRRREQLTGRRIESVLDRLTSLEGQPESILTAVVVDDHQISGELRDGFGERAALVSRAAPCLAVTDDARMVSVAFDVPNPPEPFARWGDSVEIDRSWFEPTGRFTLALVRSDLFAMGVYEGRERTAFHGFDSELKSNHSKGGFSQSRFERIRDGQIDTHLGRCQEALAERPDDAPLFVVGERSVLGAVSDAADATAAVDATGDPEQALEDAFEDFWTVTLYGI
ncbi:Vms1/Ankzf1 family peptidyl-tRNA hydrolase [Halapricum hydrolyticum]|uniref:Vms1/Ankzf1 family peptidyl-tRNA hydrolase n=1 Tax=Halapricum hydrolyticum TaxID=2979991 RepID=A0AAE3IDU6_9EURY|nr:Vms1/Ankzf1 family peptidyl-tRNA hydrolase [Halapricum hydrolyticum]MCU4717702.1 Vms1/Ankzf1 family peptidyl-tRNA hydrolase [Halapricum hydrolyticum]MCU4726769.1 Vms1/Ankzf1 family peptidyl-tRNA hydrolase [Halapricum hydrolyticum]